MLELLKKEANKTLTENMAVTNLSTLSDCLDLFATVGALRDATDDEISSRFMRAYTENPNIAMKLAFFARDVRGGLGERRVFRTILRWLAVNKKVSLEKNIPNIPEYGRFDDLLTLLDSDCEKNVLSFIGEQMKSDTASMSNGGAVSLLAKWLPSVNASSAETVKNAKKIARALGLKDEEYRKKLSQLRAYIKIIENNLRKRDYSFDYEKQPSKALFKYRKAFLRNDGERYNAFLNRVASGKASLKTGSLTPYTIIAQFFTQQQPTDEERVAIDVTWNAQEDFTNGENALVVVDGSASMYGGGPPLPAAIALSLGIYFAERNTGIFHNHFITFSCNPRLVEIKGIDILDRLRYCIDFNEVANTNIQKVFELVLETAVNNNVSQAELPSMLYFISDMEFDSCSEDAGATNFEYARGLFERNGYKLPGVVFWNVASRNRQQPVTKNDQDIVLVSGSTPRVFSMLKSGTLSPYAFMMEVLNSERYANIMA